MNDIYEIEHKLAIQLDQWKYLFLYKASREILNNCHVELFISIY